MLGIDGVRVLEAREVDGEVELTVETTTDREWCRSCGVRAHSKGRPRGRQGCRRVRTPGSVAVGQASLALP
jgi:hypothetical protein